MTRAEEHTEPGVPAPTTTATAGATDAVGATARVADSEPQPRRKLVFVIVSLALFMVGVDETIVATALDTLHHDLGASINWTGWTITIYALGQIVSLPVAGKLSDMYGRRRIFLVAVVVFTVSSLLCGFASNIYWLVPLRAIQAIGGGAFMPAASGIVSDMFGRDRDRALGMFTSIFPIGGMTGPLLGGLVVEYWSWRGMFFLNIPIGVLLFVLGVIFIPRIRTRARQRFDLLGLGLLAVLLLSTMLGITSLGSAPGGFTDSAVLIPECVGAVALVLFVWHARRAAAPFIPPRLLYGRGFGVMNFINFLFGSVALGFQAVVPLYGQVRYGMSSLTAGSVLTARSIGMVGVAALAVMALRRTGYRLPMLVGMGMIALSMVLIALPPPSGVGPYLWLSVTAALTGLGMGISIPAANNAVLKYALDQIAATAGLRGMFRQSGGIVAISITTAILARSANEGTALAGVFVGLAVVLVVAMPPIFLIEDDRGRF